MKISMYRLAGFAAALIIFLALAAAIGLSLTCAAPAPGWNEEGE